MSVWHHDKKKGKVVSSTPLSDLLAIVAAIFVFAIAGWFRWPVSVAVGGSVGVYAVIFIGGRMMFIRALSEDDVGRTKKR